MTTTMNTRWRTFEISLDIHCDHMARAVVLDILDCIGVFVSVARMDTGDVADGEKVRHYYFYF